MRELFSFIKEKTGYVVQKSSDRKIEDEKQLFIIGRRVNTISIDRFRRNLQLSFVASSEHFKTAHEAASKILDAAFEWYDSNPDANLLGTAPEVNGINDDESNGIFVTELTMQIGYLAI